jgi:hypothetical protein
MYQVPCTLAQQVPLQAPAQTRKYHRQMMPSSSRWSFLRSRGRGAGAALVAARFRQEGAVGREPVVLRPATTPCVRAPHHCHPRLPQLYSSQGVHRCYASYKEGAVLPYNYVTGPVVGSFYKQYILWK